MLQHQSNNHCCKVALSVASRANLLTYSTYQSCSPQTRSWCITKNVSFVEVFCLFLWHTSRNIWEINSRLIESINDSNEIQWIFDKIQWINEFSTRFLLLFRNFADDVFLLSSIDKHRIYACCKRYDLVNLILIEYMSSSSRWRWTHRRYFSLTTLQSSIFSIVISISFTHIAFIVFIVSIVFIDYILVVVITFEVRAIKKYIEIW